MTGVISEMTHVQGFLIRKSQIDFRLLHGEEVDMMDWAMNARSQPDHPAHAFFSAAGDDKFLEMGLRVQLERVEAQVEKVVMTVRLDEELLKQVRYQVKDVTDIVFKAGSVVHTPEGQACAGRSIDFVGFQPLKSAQERCMRLKHQVRGIQTILDDYDRHLESYPEIRRRLTVSKSSRKVFQSLLNAADMAEEAHRLDCESAVSDQLAAKAQRSETEDETTRTSSAALM